VIIHALQELAGCASIAYLSGFLFSVLPSVAPYCGPGGVKVMSGEQVVKYSAFYKSAIVPHSLDRAAIFSACRLGLLLVRPTFGGDFVGLADHSGIKDTRARSIFTAVDFDV
jgi:hypothetical protein